MKKKSNNSKELRIINSERRVLLLCLDICRLCDKHMADKQRPEGPITIQEVRETFAKLLHDEMVKEASKGI